MISCAWCACGWWWCCCGIRDGNPPALEPGGGGGIMWFHGELERELFNECVFRTIDELGTDAEVEWDGDGHDGDVIIIFWIGWNACKCNCWFIFKKGGWIGLNRAFGFKICCWGTRP